MTATQSTTWSRTSGGTHRPLKAPQPPFFFDELGRELRGELVLLGQLGLALGQDLVQDLDSPLEAGLPKGNLPSARAILEGGSQVLPHLALPDVEEAGLDADSSQRSETGMWSTMWRLRIATFSSIENFLRAFFSFIPDSSLLQSLEPQVSGSTEPGQRRADDAGVLGAVRRGGGASATQQIRADPVPQQGFS
jgi:hypothetical protein